MVKLDSKEIPYIMLITLLLGIIVVLGSAVSFFGAPTGQFRASSVGFVEHTIISRQPIRDNSTCYDSDGGVNKMVYGCVTYGTGNDTMCDYCITNQSICELDCTDDGFPYCVADTSCGNTSMYCDGGACQYS